MHPKQVPILIVLSMTLAFSMMFAVSIDLMIDSSIDRLVAVLAVISTAVCGVFVGVYIPRTGIGGSGNNGGIDAAIAELTTHVDNLVREVSVSPLDDASVTRQIAQVKSHTSQIAKVLAYHVKDPSASVAIEPNGAVHYVESSRQRKSRLQSPTGTAAPVAPRDPSTTGSKR